MHLLTRAFLAFIALYGVTIFLISEPLGDAAERYLVKLASPFIADLTYHGEPFGFVRDQFFTQRDTKSHHKIVNVVVDDDSLQREEASYPLNYAQYARHLELIGQRQPKAIFVDVWLHDKRVSDETMGELVDVICRLANPSDKVHKSAIKIYLLSLRPHGRFLHPELQRVSQQTVEAGQPYCFSEVSAVVPVKEAEQKGWYYPFKTCSDQGCIPSAAVAIYNDALAGATEQKIPENVTGNFFLIWSNRTPDQAKLNNFFKAVYGDKMEVDEECKNHKSIFHFLNFFIPDKLLPELVAHNSPVCRPFLQFNTYEVAQARLRKHAEDAGQYLHGHLFNSVVIYGYNLAGINDFVDSPLHGSTSGLNFHGMAIENLDRIGNGVIRESAYRSFCEDFLSRENFYMITLCLLGAVIQLYRHRMKAKFQGNNESTAKDDRLREEPNQATEKFIRRLLNVLIAIGLFLVVLSIFVMLNGLFLRLDYTVLVEGVFFALALSSLAYVEAFITFTTEMVNRLKRILMDQKKGKRE